MTLTASGVDSSLYFDNDLLKSGLTDALLSEMEASPAHMGDIIDRRDHADGMGDTNALWVMGDEAYFQKWTGSKTASDKLGLYKQTYSIADYYKLVEERITRMRREQTRMLEPWVRGIGKTYVPGQEAELFSIVFQKEDLDGATETLTGFDGQQLFSASHAWDVAGSSHAAHPDVIGQTYSNDVELPATLSDAVTVGTAWSRLAVEDAWKIARRTMAGWRTDKNRPFNFLQMSDVMVLTTNDDSTNAGLVDSVEAAFDTNYQLRDDRDKPFKGRATPRQTPWITTTRDDRLYFAFKPMGTDGQTRQQGRGALVLVDHIAPEMVDVETLQGMLSVNVDASHGYAIGQWWQMICVRLNGAPASDA